MVILMCFMPGAVFLLKAKGQKVETNETRTSGCRMIKAGHEVGHPTKL